MILIGCLSALGSAVLYPFMFLFFGKIVGTFVDLKKYQVLNATRLISRTTMTTRAFTLNSSFLNMTSNPQQLW